MQSLSQHRRALFGLCYRMTGCAADAEDLVQETFRRALEHPPDLSAPLRPWLTRVATNLCIDTLRKRKNEAYFGPWLPSPIETARIEADLEPGPEARYSVMESATMAFLIALEALTPQQRAVLVLRDVLGMTGPEVAIALEMSEANVRVSLHRAGAALSTYDEQRTEVGVELRARTQAALHAFLAALVMGDVARLQALLADDLRATSDAAGEVHALVTPVVGRDRVLTTLRSLQKVGAAPVFIDARSYNGLPAFAVRSVDRGRPIPTRYVFQAALDTEGRIAQLWIVIASRKLQGIAFDD